MKLETLQTDFDQFKSEYDTPLEVHHQSAPAVLHSNQSVLQHGSDNKHIVTTPRPNWEQCSDILGGSERCKELFEGQSGQKILLQQMNGQNELFSGLSDQEIEELLAVAQTELRSNGVRIAYQTLYAEDTDVRHEVFLSLVKKQATSERLQYISELRVQLEGKG